ncbi:MAG: hypothetical protein Q7T03_01750 [Deltaproteobacteria bacterium]|nr:hypothetical protein [Deltaproteobacteria bacterium]
MTKPIDIRDFGTLDLKLEVSRHFKPLEQELYRLEGVLNREECTAVDRSEPESHWAADYRHLQHIRAGFRDGTGRDNQWLGHNVKPAEPCSPCVAINIIKCRFFNYPLFHTDLSNGFFTPEEVRQEIFGRMEKIVSHMHRIVNALLCKRELPGLILKWEKDTPQDQYILISDLNHAHSVSIFFNNLDEDPVPESMAVYFDGQTQIDLSGVAGVSFLLWAEQFQRVFTKEVQCNQSATIEDGEPSS